MEKTSLKEKLVIYAKGKRGFINVGEFERLAISNGFLGQNAGRRCRELANAGFFERRLNEGGSVEYRIKPLVASGNANRLL